MRVFACLSVIFVSAISMGQVVVDVPVGEVVYTRPSERVVVATPQPVREAEPAAREEARKNLIPIKPVLRGRIGAPASGGLSPMMPDMRSLRRAQLLNDLATGPWEGTALIATTRNGIKTALGVLPNVGYEPMWAGVSPAMSKGYCAL